ncbi:MAG TPA: hypothetical protein VF471_06105 [Pseudoxanthomonas sp.]
MSRRLARTSLVLLISALCGCALFDKSQRPLDISDNMPGVSDFLQTVQAAIDATDSHAGWGESHYYVELSAACEKDTVESNSKHKKVCDAAIAGALKQCDSRSAATAVPVCVDSLRRASLACDAEKPKEPDACTSAKLIAPPRITSAKVELLASSTTSAGLTPSIKLISLDMSRAMNRKHSLVAVLIPLPAKKAELMEGDPNLLKDIAEYKRQLGILYPRSEQERIAAEAAQGDNLKVEMPISDRPRQALIEARARFDEQHPVARDKVGELTPATTPANKSSQQLYGALMAMLDTAVQPAPKPGAHAPKLTLQSATYQFAVDYKVVNKAEVKWSISPLKLSGGAGGGTDKLTGNILTVEISR